MSSNIEFEKHSGTLDHKTDEVNFYGLSFKTIVHAVRYLKDIPPDDYNMWSYENLCGLYLNGYFYHNKTWYNEPAFKDLLGIKD